jgi:hypothetical protein
VVVAVAVAVAVLEAEHSAVMGFEWFEALVDAWEAVTRGKRCPGASPW